MNYLPLDQYPRKWIFSHASMPVPEADLANIRPLTQARSAQIWNETISRQSSDADHFDQSDWPRQSQTWQALSVDWQTAWESDEVALPEDVLAFCEWEENTTVYFCYGKYNLIETQWGVFCRHWKNFLFFDDQPFLIGRKRTQTLWFQPDGHCLLGTRPALLSNHKVQ